MRPYVKSCVMYNLYICEIFFCTVRMAYVLHRRKKKAIITVFSEGGKAFFGYSVCRVGSAAMRIEEEHRTGRRLSTFLF
jgi:hypothetical protein